MAIKIVKEGPSVFQRTCLLCGSLISYEYTDLDDKLFSPYISCPKCGNKIYHKVSESNNKVRSNLNE